MLHWTICKHIKRVILYTSLYRERPGGPGRHQVGQESAISPCGEECQEHPGLH